MAQNNKQHVFQNVARVINSGCCKTPQTHRGNGERTYATNTIFLRSTKKAPQTVMDEEAPHEENNEETYLVCATIHEYDELGRVYMDQKGHFP
eukprot:11484676-Ditylum_brightwellii.AAC.1